MDPLVSQPFQVATPQDSVLRSLLFSSLTSHSHTNSIQPHAFNPHLNAVDAQNQTCFLNSRLTYSTHYLHLRISKTTPSTVPKSQFCPQPSLLTIDGKSMHQLPGHKRWESPSDSCVSHSSHLSHQEILSKCIPEPI